MRYNKNQLNAYRGVLKNKNLAKVMEEGLTAPVGSTKRKRAQKMLSILKKTTIDGQGGPGPRKVPRVNVQLRPSTVDYRNLLILPPAPKIRVPFGEPAPTPRPEHDGQGYPGPMDGKGFLGFGGSTAPTASNLTINMAGAAPKAGGLVVPPYSPSFGSKLMGGLKSARLTSPLGVGLTAASIAVPTVGKNIVWGLQDRLVDHEADPAFRTAGSTAPYQEVLPPGQTATGNRAAAPAPTTPTWGGQPMSGGGRTTPANTINGKSLKDLSIEWAGGTPGMANFVDSPTGEDATAAAAASSSLNGRFPGVQAAVDANMGPTMFAANSLKDEEGGGNLYERLMRIEEATRKSYGLDQMKDQLNAMIVSGNTLGERLGHYITGRDEFLNETEDMISDLKQRSLKMDMSDPRTRSNMNQNMNYLYEMRGRQNKRYIEFMNSSIAEYEGKIAAAQSVYDTEFARYENDVLNKQNIAKEDYQNMFTGLQEMYNTVAGAEMAALEKELMEYQVGAAYNAYVKDAVGLTQVNSGDWVQLDKDLKQVGYIDENGAWVPNNGSLELSGANVYALAGRMSDAVGRAMFTYVDGVQGNPVDKDKALRTAQNALMVLDALKAQGAVTGEAYIQHQETIKNHLSRALEANQNFLNTTDQLPSYRKAIQSLAGDGWFPWGSGRKTPTREEFIKKWGAGGVGLDGQMLNTIYSNLEASTQAGETPRSFVDTFLTKRGDFAQEGEAIDSDAVLRRNMIHDYMQRLQPAPMANNLSFSTTSSSSGVGTRAQRNNNPLNIKASEFTQSYNGVSGIDQSPASDGGNFLQFNSPEAGFAAAARLLSADSYRNLTVDAAMRRWSNNGYGGNIMPTVANKTIAQLTPAELNSLVQAMARAEGYFA